AVGGAGAVARRLALVRRAALPLAPGDAIDRYRRRDERHRRGSRTAMRHDRSSGVSDAAAVAAIGAVFALGALIWLWGGIAGAIFGAGWPRVAPGQLLGVVLRLATRLPDPAGAWPAADRARLRGAGGFYGVGFALGLAGAALAVAAARTASGWVAGERAGERWARSSALRPLRSAL